MSLNNPMVVPISVSSCQSEISLGVSEPTTVEMTVSGLVYVDYPQYEGETTVTPTQETQVLQTIGTLVTDNITINPIPNNYGLISWNGSVLTVS